MTMRLDNGLEISCRSRGEVAQFFRDIFVERIYTTHGPDLNAGDIVFDVGANIGLFALFAGSLPGVTIFAFEPAPETFALLEKNLAHSNACCLNVGLGSRPEVRHFTYYPRSPGMSSFYATQEDEAKVLKTIITTQIRDNPGWKSGESEELMASLDELIALRLTGQVLTCRLETVSRMIRRYELPRIDFLKIDVQKSELDVLLGIEEQHWPLIRQIAMELHAIDRRLETTTALLERHGYSVSVMQDWRYVEVGQYYIFAKRVDEGPMSSEIKKRAEVAKAAIGSLYRHRDIPSRESEG